MPNADLHRISPPFAAWLSNDATSTLPPEPVNNFQMVLETPREDKFRIATIAGYEALKSGAGGRFSDASTQRLYAERRRWSKTAVAGCESELSLLDKFATWDKRKQDSLVESLAAFQVHSFAIEGASLSEAEVRESTAAHLLAARRRASQ